MKIKFKSTRKYDNDDKKIEFISRLSIEKEEDFTALLFNENRNGKIIANRIEYNEDTLKIFSGISSLQCKLNEIIKNHFIVENMNTSLFIYTKMKNIDISNDKKLLFEYLVCHDDQFIENTEIKLELEIIE